MSRFHIALFDHCVLQGRIYSLMPKEPLKLLYRHSLINGHCRQRPPKLMRMYFRNVQTSAHLAEPMLDAANLYPLVRSPQCNEQDRIFIRPTVKILLQMQLCPSIKVHNPLLVTLAEHHAFPLMPAYRSLPSPVFPRSYHASSLSLHPSMSL